MIRQRLKQVAAFFRPVPVFPPQKQSVHSLPRQLLNLSDMQHHVLIHTMGWLRALSLLLTWFFVMILTYLAYDRSAPWWLSCITLSMAAVCGWTFLRQIRITRQYIERYVRQMVRIKEKRASWYGAEGQRKRQRNEQVKAYTGWDHKACEHCSKPIELLAAHCPHCGSEQAKLLAN